ncbi:hypothetical protein [Oryza sativa Japonica Group]|uniref:Uncharacterized protein n=1 Tax=Oryza sativa subsp. japonica TaxID=39947 RepID=Q5ZCQ2_ORYSJ|nr:hypothetical protein [Oryza sativa Japonica Group]
MAFSLPSTWRWCKPATRHARGEERGWRARRGEWGGREEGKEAEIDGRMLQFNEKGEERGRGGDNCHTPKFFPKPKLEF